jgi:hypothetical protein
VKIVPVQLSQALANPGLRRASGSLDAVMAAAAARRLAEQELLPGLLEWRQLLLDAGVDLVLGYDAALGIAVWVDLSDADRPSGPVVVQAVEDQLQIGVRPGAVDLVVRSEPVTGSEVWLHLMNAERRSPPVVIRCDPTSRLEVAVAPDAGMESSERVALTGHTILPVPEGFQVEHPTNGGTGNPAGIYVGQTARLISKRAAGTAAEMPAIRLTRLVPVPVASVWRDLAQWLFQNGSLLSEITGIEIELKSREYNVGQLSVDMSGRDKSTGNLVIIKSQYGPASNEHLEQILSYAKATRPVTIIWVAEEFPEQHQLTLDRLNAQTDAASSFFGIRLDAVTLAGAPADLIAPRLELVVKPDQNDKQS